MLMKSKQILKRKITLLSFLFLTSFDQDAEASKMDDWKEDEVSNSSISYSGHSTKLKNSDFNPKKSDIEEANPSTLKKSPKNNKLSGKEKKKIIRKKAKETVKNYLEKEKISKEEREEIYNIIFKGSKSKSLQETKNKEEVNNEAVRRDRGNSRMLQLIKNQVLKEAKDAAREEAEKLFKKDEDVDKAINSLKLYKKAQPNKLGERDFSSTNTAKKENKVYDVDQIKVAQEEKEIESMAQRSYKIHKRVTELQKKEEKKGKKLVKKGTILALKNGIKLAPKLLRFI